MHFIRLKINQNFLTFEFSAQKWFTSFRYFERLRICHIKSDALIEGTIAHNKSHGLIKRSRFRTLFIEKNALVRSNVLNRCITSTRSTNCSHHSHCHSHQNDSKRVPAKLAYANVIQKSKQKKKITSFFFYFRWLTLALFSTKRGFFVFSLQMPIKFFY